MNRYGVYIFPRLLKGIFSSFLLLFWSLVALVAFIGVFTYARFQGDVITKEKILNRKDTGFILLDRDNRPFFSFGGAKRKSYVLLPEIPLHVRQAVIVMEDKDFYHHPGFSLKAIARSLIRDIERGGFKYGGSTLTQQLVKNSLLKPERKILRKYQEILLAYEVERRYSKDEILEMYLNTVYFGESASGIEDAAKLYFNKRTRDLTVAEGSMLAGFIPAPSYYNPFSGSMERAKARQGEVLSRMVENGFISNHEKELAKNEQVSFHMINEDVNTLAPHFALYVKHLLETKYGESLYRSGYRIQTTLDTNIQQDAEEIVRRNVITLEKNGVRNGAAVVIDPATGQILAMVGSYNWYDEIIGKVNLATTSRQPGSSFKPIVYALAMEKRLITPATVLHDMPKTYRVQGSPPYRPVNYDRRFRGRVLVRRALANSLNVPSVEVMNVLGVENVLDGARKLGITTLGDSSNYGLSLVLGSGETTLMEMTNVYATFANAGTYHPPASVIKIIDRDRNIVEEYRNVPTHAIDSGVAYLISSILSDQSARREVFGRLLDTKIPAAVKTGTTDNYRDAWTIGYTPTLAVGVWVGNNDNAPMDRIAGSLGAAPIWRELMETILNGKTVKAFAPPANVIKLSVCSGNGQLARSATTSAILEYFLTGTQPTKFCTWDKPPPVLVQKIEN